MRQIVVPWTGGIPGYGDARPDGRYVVSVPALHVVTDQGIVPKPEGQAARYVTLPHFGDDFACTWSDGGPDRAKEWTGTAWEDRGLSCGTNAVIYDLADELRVSRCEPPQGSQGWRYVDEAGRLVTCDTTYADVAKGLFEWTAWSDVRIGQGNDGAVVWFPDLGPRRLSFDKLRVTGNLRNIRARRTSNDFAITVVDYDQHLTTITWATLAELRAMPALEVQAPVEIPKIGRRMWCGWFEFQPATLPGNCELPVAPEMFVTAGGTRFAAYVAGTPDGDVASLERNAAAAKVKFGLPVIAYWTRKAQEGRVPRGADWIGVEAYRLKDESLLAFETRVLASVRRCGKVALICQCYTSNALQTTDLASLVPVYARIARDCSNVVAVLVFSGSGRPTGLQDNPSVRPLWEALAAGIPGPPEVEDDVINQPKVEFLGSEMLGPDKTGLVARFRNGGNPEHGIIEVTLDDGIARVQIVNAGGRDRSGKRPERRVL